MSDVFDAVETLGQLLNEVNENLSKLEDDKMVLEDSVSGAQTLSELQNSLETLLGRYGVVLQGISRANRDQAGTLADQDRLLRGKLRHAYLELERSRALAVSTRKQEDKALDDLEKNLRSALGREAKDVAAMVSDIILREQKAAEKADDDPPSNDKEK